MLLTIIGLPGNAVGQVATATATDDTEYVVAYYTNSKYYALPHGTSASVWNGTEVTLNSINKVDTETAASLAWTLMEGETAGQFYMTYTSGNTTYYLYKNGGTNSSNYNIKGSSVQSERHYWEFTLNSGNNDYTVKSLKSGTGSATSIYLGYATAGKYGVYAQANAAKIVLLEIGDVPADPLTVTLGDDNTSLTEDSAGAGVTLPTRPDVSPYTFAGWSTTNITQETTTATIIPAGEYHPTQNITLYPLYSRAGGSTTTWTKYVASSVAGHPASITEGVYVLLTGSERAFNGTISSGHGQSTTNAFTFTDNVATSAPTGTCDITMIPVKNGNTILGYKMYNADYGYLYAVSASSGNLAWHESESSYWSYTNYDWCYNNNSAHLRVYNNTFRTYNNSTNTQIKVAKKESVTIYYYISVVSSDPSITASDVNVDWEATGGNIAYTINNPVAGATLSATVASGATISNFTLGTVGASPITFTCAANEEQTEKTATVTLNYVKDNETLATKSVTITQAAAPYIYTTIPALFNAATNSDVDVAVNISNWVISAVNGSNAYLTDNAGNGLIIYTSNHGFAVNDKLNGTVSCTLTKYNGAAELKGLKTTTTNLNVTHDGDVTPQNIAINTLTGVNVGALLSYADLTYDNTNSVLKDGSNNSIKPYTTLYEYTSGTFANNKKYDVKGIFVLFGGNTKEILPRSADDIVLKANMSDTDFTGLEPFTYVATAGGPSSAQQVVVYCYDLGENVLTAKAPTGYELCLTENGSYTTSVEMTPDGGGVLETLYIRLAAGHEAGDYNGKLEFNATNLNKVEVDLIGSVTSVTYYTITLTQPEHAVISANALLAAAETQITLSYSDVDDCYTFDSWTVINTTTSQPVSVTNDQFTMPASNVTVSAAFNQKQFTVSYAVNGTVEQILEETVDCGNNAPLHSAADLEGLVELPEGYTLYGWSTSANNSEIVSSYTPSDDATLYAVLVQAGITLNYVKVTEDLTDWSGEYLIVNEEAGVAFDGSINNTTYDKTNNVIDVTIVDIAGGGKKIVSTNTIEASRFIVTKQNDIYTIKSAAGYYIGRTSSSTGINASNETAYTNTLSYNNTFYYVKSSNNYMLRYNSSEGQKRFRYYSGASVDPIQLYKKEVPTAYTRIENITLGKPLTLPSIEPSYLITVKNGGVLTLNGANNGDETNLIIEDGGQLKVSSAGVQATFKKTISQSTKGSAWNTISSPVGTVNDVTTVTNLVTGDGLQYNLYRYNETKSSGQWEAYDGSDFETLEKGRGYLYRNNGKEIAFAGEVNTTSATVNLTASETALSKLKGFNLIGNPFGENITMSNISGATLSGGYVITNAGAWSADPVATIQPCQGFLVQVEEPTNITITKPVSKGTTYNKEYIKFIVANSQYEDAAFALFEKGYGLNKINHRNADIPMLYINKDNRDLAIATMSDDTKSFNLNFKAMTMGQYTLSYKATGEYSYLHVIDRFTGEDVDMLLEGEYKFVATPNDNEARFIVKLGYMPDYSDVENDIFAYQNGSEILVSGEGELQIFDVIGRSVMTTMINGAESINIPAKGVYIFRLVGKEIKTQKIVVR